MQRRKLSWIGLVMSPVVMAADAGRAGYINAVDSNWSGVLN